MFSRKKKFQVEEVQTPQADNCDVTFSLLKLTAQDLSLAAIEARDHLHKELTIRENRFFNTIDSVEDIIIVKDGNGKWRTVNFSGQRFFGFETCDFFCKTDREIFQNVKHPEEFGDEFFRKSEEKDNKAWETKTPQRAIERVRSKEDEVFFYDVVRTPIFNSDGSRKELLFVGRDVTALHKKDNMIQVCYLAMNFSPESILILDRYSVIIFVNKKFLENFGYENYRDVANREFTEIVNEVSAESLDDLLKVWEDCIITQTEHDFICKALQLKINITPLQSEIYNPEYFVCTFSKVDE